MKRSKPRCFVGIDLGGTKTLTAVFNERLELLAVQKTKTQTSGGAKRFVRTFIQNIHNTLKATKKNPGRLSAIGIAVPGLVDVEKGMVFTCPNLPFLKQCPLEKLIKNHFRVPVILENDVNAGLYGEFRFGAARGYHHIVGIFPGTGIGGALILDGTLYRGAIGGAGEIGHLPVDPDRGPICGCGRRGCLEAVAGRLAIASEAAALAIKQKSPALLKLAGTDLSVIKSRMLRKAIEAGDKTLEKLVRAKANLIGVAVGGIVNFLNPELIVLGGGLVEAMPKIFLEEITSSAKECAMPELAKTVQIVTARLKDFAIVKGAAKLAAEAADRKN